MSESTEEKTIKAVPTPETLQDNLQGTTSPQYTFDPETETIILKSDLEAINEAWRALTGLRNILNYRFIVNADEMEDVYTDCGRMVALIDDKFTSIGTLRQCRPL